MRERKLALGKLYGQIVKAPFGAEPQKMLTATLKKGKPILEPVPGRNVFFGFLKAKNEEKLIKILLLRSKTILPILGA